MVEANRSDGEWSRCPCGEGTEPCPCPHGKPLCGDCAQCDREKRQPARGATL